MRHLSNNEKLVSAKYSEWQASLFGAIFVAFGVGVLLQRFVSPWAWLIIILGAVLHGWGMSKMYKRNL